MAAINIECVQGQLEPNCVSGWKEPLELLSPQFTAINSAVYDLYQDSGIATLYSIIRHGASGVEYQIPTRSDVIVMEDFHYYS